MITELVIVGATTYAYRKIKHNLEHKKEKELMVKWAASMIGSGVKSQDDKKSTFEIADITKKEYGFDCKVQIPYGLSYDKLESLLPTIQTNIASICELSKGELDTYATLKLINNPTSNMYYEPVKTKSNEIFVGYKLDGSKYILDLNKDSQILIAGTTGTGKSFLFAMVLTNLIYYNTKEFDIYLFQKMKGEIDIFKNCPSVKFTSDNSDEILVMLKKMCELIHKRSKQFVENGIKNISQWNKHFPNKKMKRIILGVEEISFFMDEENEHFQFFTQIVKAGRSAGIHFLGITQRTTAANLGGNGELKSQLTVITAKQRTKQDSINAIDIPDAANLGDQEFIASANDGFVRFKACKVDEDFEILKKYVPEIITPTKNKSENPKEKPTLHGGWHIPTSEEWNQIKHTIPEVTYLKKEEKQPAGQMEAPRKRPGRGRKGIVPLKEVLKEDA